MDDKGREVREEGMEEKCVRDEQMVQERIPRRGEHWLLAGCGKTESVVH